MRVKKKVKVDVVDVVDVVDETLVRKLDGVHSRCTMLTKVDMLKPRKKSSTLEGSFACNSLLLTTRIPPSK